MTKPNLSTTARYGIAVLSVGLALAISLWMRELIAPIPTMLFIMAVVMTAWVCGMGPAVLAAALSVPLVDYFFVPPYDSFSTDSDGIIRAAVFFVVGVSCAAFGNIRRAAEIRARRSTELLTVTLASIGDAVITTDVDGNVAFVNSVAERLTGWTMRDAVGRPLREVFKIINESTRDVVESPHDLVIVTGKIVGLANHTLLIARDGREVPVEDSGAPIRDERGAIVGVVLVFRDATERRRQEIERERLLEAEQLARAEAEIAQQRFEYLALASAKLSSSLDYESTLASVARMAVPRLADWATVDMLVDGEIKRLAVAHFDPEKVKWAWELYERFPQPKDAPTGVPAVIRTGESQFIPEVTREMIEAAVQDPELLKIVDEIGFTSSMTVPIRVRDRVAGAISFTTSESRRRFDESDLALAHDLARRASTAIEHAELYREIAHQRQSLSVTLASIGDGMISTDAYGRIVFINAVAERLVGWSADDANGRHLDEIFRVKSEATQEPVESPVARVLREKRVVEIGNGTILTDRNGVDRPIDDSAAPIRNDDGSIGGVVMIFRDATERRRSESDIQRSRDELDAILRGVSDGITAQDPTGRLIFANDAAARASGFETAEELVAATPQQIMASFELFDADGAPFSFADLPGRRALQGEPSPRQTLQFVVKATGERRWSTVYATPVVNDNGVVQFAINIFHDITAAKKAEMALRDRAAQQTALASLGQRALAETDLKVLFDDAITTVSNILEAELVKILELEPDGKHLILRAGMGWSPGLVGNARVESEEATQAGYTLKRRTPVVVHDFAKEQRFRGANLLHDHKVRSGMTVTIGIGPHPFGILGAHTREPRAYSEDDAYFLESVANILAASIIRRRVEGSLEQQREWLRVTLASIGDAVIATDTDGRITFMNPVAARLTGWDVDKVEGMQIDDVFHIVNETTREVALNPVRAALERGNVVGLANHTVMLSRDGREIPIDDSAAPIRNADGTVYGVVLVFHDVSERRKSDAERAVAEDRLHTQFEISMLLADTPTIEAAAHRVLDAVGDHLGFELGALWVIDRERNMLRFAGAWDRGDSSADAYAMASRDELLSLGERLPGRVWRDRVPFYIDNLASHPELVNGLPLAREQSAFAFPITLGNDVHGVFEFYSNTAIDSHEALVETMAAVGRQMGQFMERRRVEHELRGSEERYRTVAETASDAILIVDQASTILFANRSVEKVFGYTADELLGGDLTSLMPDYLRKVHERAMQRYVETGVRHISWSGVELPGLHRDGRTIPLEISFGEFVKDGRHFFTGIVRDITDRKESELELKLAMERAEAANASKDQFLAVLSHELRTPLTPVLTLVHYLENADEPPDDLKSIFTMIRRNVELEARLIDDLLDLTRITRGKLHLDFELVDAHALMQNAVEICREEIDAKEQELIMQLDASNYTVNADPARLQQVFWNLLQNAVKFTPVGGSVTVRSRDSKEGEIEFAIDDTGIGLEPDQLERVFNAFEQAEQSISRRYGGLGLGLSISSSIVDMLGGTIRASSDGLNAGSTFTVCLATSSPDDDSSLGHEGLPAHVGTEVPRRILLVDDHVDTSSVMKLLLERRGYDVETAADMTSGLILANEREYDLLISDIGLPDGSGHELMQRIRETKSLPGIALSGFGMEDDIRRSHEAGFSEHLIKPVNFQVLQEAIQRVMG